MLLCFIHGQGLRARLPANLKNLKNKRGALGIPKEISDSKRGHVPIPEANLGLCRGEGYYEGLVATAGPCAGVTDIRREDKDNFLHTHTHTHTYTLLSSTVGFVNMR